MTEKTFEEKTNQNMDEYTKLQNAVFDYSQYLKSIGYVNQKERATTIRKIVVGILALGV